MTKWSIDDKPCSNNSDYLGCALVFEISSYHGMMVIMPVQSVLAVLASIPGGGTESSKNDSVRDTGIVRRQRNRA